MSRKEPSLLVIFSYLPWWASVTAGVLVYVSLAYVFPALIIENPIISMMIMAGQNVAWIFALMFTLPAVSSIFKHKKRQQLLQHQQGIDTLREISWSDFEVLVGEAFRRKGFSVQENMSGGADGGVDLRISKDGKLHLVQCKHWRSSKVGVSIVREMFGVLTASKAQSVYLVTSGEFTNEAIKFANNLPITLINGHALLALINEIKTPVSPMQVSHNTIKEHMHSSEKICPKCQSQLVKRTAKKGKYMGNEFLGCVSFPRCRYTEQL
ncbi:MAG: DUF2034 domain-containing protein [Aliiglaciecola sp.]|uniref:DUF2034 domain-containing protein n=1 Tax=Aliiglaciecola sp. TaxID=1872441 RepID=UPI00329797EF